MLELPVPRTSQLPAVVAILSVGCGAASGTRDAGLGGRDDDYRWTANELWIAEVGEMRDAVAFDDQQVYALTATDGLTAIARDSGFLLWNYDSGHGGTAPLAEDGLVYAAADDLTCLDGATGAVIWTNDSVPDNNAGWSGRTMGNSSENLMFIGDSYGSLHAMVKTSGNQNWEHVPLSGDDLTLDPRFHEDAAYFGTDEYLIAVSEADSSVGYEGEQWLTIMDRDLTGAPCASGDTLFVQTVDGVLHAMNRHDGVELWATEIPMTNGDNGTLVCSGSELVVAASGNPMVVSQADGATLWTEELDRPRAYVSPVVSGDAVLIPSHDGVHAFELSSGALLGLWEGEGAVAVAVDGSTTFVSTEAGVAAVEFSE